MVLLPKYSPKPMRAPPAPSDTTARGVPPPRTRRPEEPGSVVQPAEAMDGEVVWRTTIHSAIRERVPTAITRSGDQHHPARGGFAACPEPAHVDAALQPPTFEADLLGPGAERLAVRDSCHLASRDVIDGQRHLRGARQEEANQTPTMEGVRPAREAQATGALPGRLRNADGRGADLGQVGIELTADGVEVAHDIDLGAARNDS